MLKIMEDLSVHDSKINVFVEALRPKPEYMLKADKPKVAEMTKGKSRIPARKTLADISNMPQQFTASNQDNKSGPSSDALRKYIEQLQKEYAALMRLLADKNKVIELSGTEMQKLRVTLEKVKQQNLQLAQSNSQMLAELNSVKERQKALKHELGCKNGLIIAKSLELEINKVTEPKEAEVCTVAEDNDDKHNSTSRNHNSKSLVHSNKNDNDKGKVGRLQTRRQSARFKLGESKPNEDSLKIHNVDDIPPCLSHDDDKMKVNDNNSVSWTSKKEDKEGDSFQDYDKPQEHRKTSLSRPIREAAKKVQSYKEINLVVKMRRE